MVTALVADDDAPIRNMIREILESRGVKVIEARDGLEAIAIFRKEDIDLLVTDFLMPRVDGMQVVRSVRMSGKKGKIPLVLMSAISKGHIIENQAEGPDYYVNKPFKSRKVAKLLEKILAGIDKKE